ncbi:MAG: hypothetical protein HXX12_11510 [Geothrix sp.]|uniref:DUF6544 family protein n=1 Tax=Geothrix sp. TaxID=1962974 RepID=UPI0017ABA0C7|nr:DUF6544 family protein [Geothrix sp.]NWJ41585.1 hypothetical protein [Geothrix sp.]WIL20432.1 MAG: hypothetical protein QOZ81_003002 [Geothrix sp.]
MRPGFRTRYEREVSRGLASVEPEVLVTEQELSGLPSLLQAYLRRVGVVGRPRVRNFRVRFSGEMRPSHGSGWMKIRVDQHTFLGPDPARLFLMRASRFGIPFESFHRFVGPTATMQVRVASLFQVVEARGPEMDQSETVTFFNDLCLLAPAALLEVDVRWEEGPGRTLKGTFHHQGHCVAAVLRFDDQGDLADFRSEDRYQSADGKTYLNYPWSTPIRKYGGFEGFHLMVEGDAIWQEPAGPFPYARFRVGEIAYNVGPRPEEGAP